MLHPIPLFSAGLGVRSVGFVLDMLYSMDVWGVGASKVCWKLAMKRDFEFQGFYHSLYPSFAHSFPYKMV